MRAELVNFVLRAVCSTTRCYRGGTGRTQWVAARQLWPLAVFPCQLVADAVEQVDVALLGVLLQGGDEGP